MPTWDDYLALAFDEIRQFGASSVQIMRRLRAALIGLQGITSESRAAAIHQYLLHLEWAIERAQLDPQDKLTASQEDQQGLGFSRSRPNAFSDNAHDMARQRSTADPG
jgi:hypothetical protein